MCTYFLFCYLSLCTDGVEGNAIIENLFDERIISNSLWAKINLLKALEDRVIVAKKVKTYTDTIRDSAMTVK